MWGDPNPDGRWADPPSTSALASTEGNDGDNFTDDVGDSFLKLQIFNLLPLLKHA